MGVPQGSIVSVTLFALKINSVVKNLTPGVECSLYIDFFICYRFRYMHIIERHLQQTLNKLQTWVDTNEFKFSESKIVSVHFCKLHTVNPDPVLLMNRTPVVVVEQVKFLSLIFDKHHVSYSFIPHLRYLKQKCLKALNFLIVVSSTKWGTDEKTLLHLFCVLIQSKLDYDSVVYGSARNSYLQMLEPIRNHALRLCLGAFWTSPLSSLHVEANEMPLKLRRRRLAAQYCLKVSSDTSNPALGCIFNKCFSAFFQRYSSQIRPLGFCVSSDLHAIHFTRKDILPVVTAWHPPWL